MDAAPCSRFFGIGSHDNRCGGSTYRFDLGSLFHEDVIDGGIIAFGADCHTFADLQGRTGFDDIFSVEGEVVAFGQDDGFRPVYASFQCSVVGDHLFAVAVSAAFAAVVVTTSCK